MYQNLIMLARRECRITWHDEETDAKVQTIVENAVPHLWHKFGIPGDPSPGIFEVPGTERMLFGNYCGYCWNNVPEAFEQNYRRDILTVRHRYEVEAARNAAETPNLQ